MRQLFLRIIAALAFSAGFFGYSADGPFMADGIKIGEVDQDSAIVWTRLTQNETFNVNGIPWSREDEAVPPGKRLEDMAYSAVGSEGDVRLIYWPENNRSASVALDWTPVEPNQNFTAVFHLKGLSPNTDYALSIQARPSNGQAVSFEMKGAFKTAPQEEAAEPVTFAVITCHDFPRRDDLEKGHHIYQSILKKVNPDFLVAAGDLEYYDKPEPWAKNEALARYKWDRIFALPNFKEFYRQVPAYFMKDDHDLLKNDCYPGDSYGELTWDMGIALFKENFPMGELPYRTVRWGRDLQIWMMEGRDYRSQKNMVDGPEKSIWGKTQKEWFFRTFSESDATFRILVNPDPVVGPDRANKKDNHANSVFAYEGREIRKFMGKQKNAYMINGDRHWQYVTVDDETGAREYSCGASSDMHAGGFKESLRTEEHRFLRIKGGFLSVSVNRVGERPRIALRHHDVHGEVVHEDLFWGD